MKKHFFLLSSILLATYFVAPAQVLEISKQENLTSEAVYSAKTDISPLVLISFAENYPMAKDEAWAKTKNGYLVNFKANGILYNVFLNKKGQMTSQIRFYYVNDLPATIRDQVRSTYGCFAISSVKEVTSGNKMVYLVTINDATSWKVIRVAGSEMDVFEEYQKS